MTVDKTVKELLQGFPVILQLRVAWGEMDAFGHVNNIVYFRYFESARIVYFERIQYMESMQETGIGMILGSTQCRYRLPLTYPDTISVGARAHTLEADRFSMDYKIISHKHLKVAAEGGGVIVSYDYKQAAKAPLPDVIRERITALEAGGTAL
jgi:acyl-CoA thioester hydrolase